MRRLLALSLVLSACESGVQPGTGIGSVLRVAGAQYVAGDPPPADPAAPMITEVDSLNNNIHPGQVGKRVTGRMGRGGRAVVLSFAGDAGYWILPGANEDGSNPGDIDFDARLTFSADLTPGMHDLVLQATDGDGRAGMPATLGLTAGMPPPIPGTTVDVQLTWDSEADLDLLVELPDGTVVWNGNINSHAPPPPPQMDDPNAWMSGGILDQDSNAQCVIDGRRMENVYWTQSPPSGTYQVRVDTYSLCGQPAARWQLALYYGGQLLSSASGAVGEQDIKTPHDEHSGVLGMNFEVQ